MNFHLSSCAAIAVLGSLSACSGEGDPSGSGDTGGTATGGGTSAGGTDTGGGTSTGGTDTGGGTSTGGTDTGGGLGTGGSNDGSGGNGAVEASFDTVKLIFSGYRDDVNCAASDCHSGGHNGHPLRLADDGQLYTELTTYISAACGDIPLVTPGDPENSALLKVLRGPCIAPGLIARRMPAGCFEDEWENNCVADDYIAAVEEWIAQGAPEH